MEEPLILDRYRPLADLGSGGHGSVVLAFDTRMARRVAIKRLPLPGRRSGAAARTGLAEARTAAMLNHPNIVTVHEWDTDADEAFIVMEDLDGASLADLLDETGKPFTLDEAAAIVSAVVAAVTFAHKNGVLHLDLKPANVMVTREGIVKVADFGISALTDAAGRATGSAGTIGYMPPEQLRGEELDERTDCWALAALVYELLANANPFDADSAEGSLFKIEVAELPAPSEFEPGLSEGIDDVLLAALAADPDERYGTVAGFGRALMPLLGDPAEGREALRELVSEAEAEEPAEYAPLGLWDRLAPHAGLARRAGGALAAVWLMRAGLGVFGLAGAPLGGAAAIAALAGALAPGLGMALGLMAFAAGLWHAFGPAVGLIFAGLAGVHWAVRGRTGAGDAPAAVFGPMLGVARAASALPLLFGFVFPPLPAALSAGIAALGTLAASAASGRPAPLLAVSARFAYDPVGTAVTSGGLAAMLDWRLLIVVAAWMASAAVCSVGCARGTRGGAFAGIAGGGAIILTGYAAWSSLLGQGGFGATALALDLSCGLALAICVAMLGAPTRPEPE